MWARFGGPKRIGSIIPERTVEGHEQSWSEGLETGTVTITQRGLLCRDSIELDPRVNEAIFAVV